MSLAKEDVRKLIDIYIRAWTTQDPDLILTIFTPFRSTRSILGNGCAADGRRVRTVTS